MARRKKKSSEKVKEGPALAGITRYQGEEISAFVLEAAKLEGKSVAKFQRDLVFAFLEKKFGTRFIEAKERATKKYKAERWRHIYRLRNRDR